jgi:hypothetical protein
MHTGNASHHDVLLLMCIYFRSADFAEFISALHTPQRAGLRKANQHTSTFVSGETPAISACLNHSHCQDHQQSQ